MRAWQPGHVHCTTSVQDLNGTESIRKSKNVQMNEFIKLIAAAAAAAIAAPLAFIKSDFIFFRHSEHTRKKYYSECQIAQMQMNTEIVRRIRLCSCLMFSIEQVVLNVKMTQQAATSWCDVGKQSLFSTHNSVPRKDNFASSIQLLNKTDWGSGIGLIETLFMQKGANLFGFRRKALFRMNKNSMRPIQPLQSALLRCKS